MTARIYWGDCLETLRALPDSSIDSIVTDPPYGLSKEPDMVEVLKHWLAGDDYKHKGAGFMGKSWDSFVPGPAIWRECLRVLKPGGHLLAFFGTRTQDMGTLAIRLAGFEIRDSLAWVYGSGFPKSLDVSKTIDKAAGAEREVVGFDPVAAARSTAIKTAAYGDIAAPATDAAKQWAGWGTALKPALEPITLARKPLIGTVATNVQAHGVGALNIDGCRVPGESTARSNRAQSSYMSGTIGEKQKQGDSYSTGSEAGRWPANLIHDGSDDVLALFPSKAGASAPVTGKEPSAASSGAVTGERARVAGAFHADSGSAARFFYCAKASKRDRGEGNTHPTVKPVELMRWLLRLVTPPGGLTLDPFAGSGSTGVAAELEGFDFIGCELELPHLEIILSRIDPPTVGVVFSTMFDQATGNQSGLSEPSGFDCIEDVLALLGEPLRHTGALAVYDGVVYSVFPLTVDGAVSPGDTAETKPS